MANKSGDRSNLRGLVLLMLTSGLFIMGLLFDYMPAIVDSQIKRTVELATNEEIKAIWSKPPVDIHSYYWLYDVLNSEGRLEKKIIELSSNKFRLIYNSTSHLRLNESDLAEQQLLDEPLVLLNPIHATLLEATRENGREMEQEMRAMVQGSANRLIERFNETIFLNLTARQALLGRKLLLLSKVRKLVETFGLKAKLPADVLPNDMFGYVALQNKTWRGPFEIYTGYQATANSLGDLISYQGRRRLQEYQGKCNRIQASLGELRPMPIGEEQVLELYYPDFCRILHLKPNGVRKLREGLAISYSFSGEDLASARTNPDKRCFCQNGTIDDYCSLDGAIELAPCNNFSPLVATIRGIEPDERILNSIADFEPELLASDIETQPPADNSSQMLVLKRVGIPIKADLTITMFMKVVRDPSFSSTANVPAISYVPLVMVRMIVVIPPSLAQVILNLENFLVLANHLKVIMYLSTIVLLCWLTGEYYASFAADRVRPTNGLPPDARSDSVRANSADSNRSQPPSRLSRSSLEGGDSGNSQPPRQLIASELATSEEQKQKGKAQTGGRIFSKVDEELALRSAKLENRASVRNQVQTGRSVQSQVAGSTGAKKSWFVRVSLRFVRMLNDLRESINDASHLEANENNYQDRQLELLAGKIDNWYSKTAGSSPGEPSREQLADEQHASEPADSKPDSGEATTQAMSSSSSSVVAGEREEGQADERRPSLAKDEVQDKSLEVAHQDESGGRVGPSKSPAAASNRDDTRIDSGQSNQTIINRSDTSGDETGSVLLARDDKTSALRKLELTLDTDSLPAQPASESKPTIKTTTAAAADNDKPANGNGAEREQPQGRQQALTKLVPDQSTKSDNNNQFDESSSKQSNKLGSNRVVAATGQPASSPQKPPDIDQPEPSDLFTSPTADPPEPSLSASEVHQDDAISSINLTNGQVANQPSIKPSAGMQQPDEMKARLQEEPKLASPELGNLTAIAQNGNSKSDERKLTVKGRPPLMGRTGAAAKTSAQSANGIGNNISNGKAAAVGQARG